MEWTRYIVFFLVFSSVLGSGHWYLYRRFVRDVTGDGPARRIGRWVMIGLFAMLMAAGPIGWILRNPLSEVVGVAAWAWLGVAFYLGISVAALGLLRWIGLRAAKLSAARAARAAPVADPGKAAQAQAPVDPARRLFLARAVAGGAAAASAGLTTYGAFRAYAAPEITEVPVKLAKLPKALDGLTIAQVSDIHVGPTIGRKFMDDMVARVNALKPDLVAITGDLVDGSVGQLGHAVSALQNLKSRYGSVFITGNHEYYSGDEEWCAALQGMGVQVLRNQRTTIGDAGGSFDLMGVDDWTGFDERRYDLDPVMQGRDPERAAVLLAHQPKGFEKAAERGIDLQLSGHTHGGQMAPFNFLVALTTPFTAGYYRHQGAHLYVSRGTGYWGPPFRVGSPPEIVKVVLQAA